MGCHLEGEYNTGNNFSNITGERIAFRERFADFVYQSPIPFQLGVDTDNKIEQFSSNTKMFFRYRDRSGVRSKVFAFSDRNSNGNNPSAGFPSMSHNAIMAHSIRGKVSPTNEGPRYCVACHVTDGAYANYGTQYETFRIALRTRSFGSIDFNLLQTHIGRNPGNQLNSPFFPHMVAGLGSGLFLFDSAGRPVNPLDDDANRRGCDGVSPKDRFNLGNVFFDLDKIANENGTVNGSNNHPMLNPTPTPIRRDGAGNTSMSGPLGMRIIDILTNPANRLNSWIDADGNLGGNASTFVK